MSRTWRAGTLLMMAGVATCACGSAQLLAPTSSTITVSAPTRGRLDPVEAETVNGFASTVFFADGASGLAEIRATSGAAGGGTDSTNVVQLTVGAAAVNTVTLRANPGSVGPDGGSVQLSATVVGENGETLPSVVVTFNTDQGTLSASTVTTDGNGEALTTLTTSQQAVVSATAGATTSSTVTVRAGPIVSIACAPAAGTGNCAAVQADTTNNTATVLFTVTKATGSSTLSTATLDFGDGTSLHSLGNLAGGSATVTRTYSGPTGAIAVSYTAVVQATDINGESASTSTIVVVTPRATLTPINVALSATSETATAQGQRWVFTATATGGGEGTANAAIESYAWDFKDGTTATTSGNATAHVYATTTAGATYAVTVTATTADHRTAVGRTEILVKFP